jgi:hypothetical protein
MHTTSAPRNIQVMKVRDLYLSTKHPNYQLARFILDKEHSDRDEPEVVESLRDTIPTIAALRDLLFSDQLYENQELFDRWCRALESGVLRGTFKSTPQPIESSITAWHEAHFRFVPNTLYIFTRFRYKPFCYLPNFIDLNYGTLCHRDSPDIS